LSAPDDLLVACLCAQWCGVCRSYAGQFAQVQARFPQVRFVWIDVEDQSELVDPIEVDTFPTLLIAAAGQPVFFGALAAQPGTLERLVRQNAGRGSDAAAITDPDLQALVRRLQAPL